jgi:indole-3-glycerol phosphate synthase
MIRIEKANIEDYMVILEIQKIAFKREAEFYHNDQIQPLTQTFDQLIEECREKVVLKALSDDRIVGSVRANSYEKGCWVSKLVVLPEYQRRGIGAKLLREIENYFPGSSLFSLGTGAESTSNIRLYQKVGYQIVEKTTFHDGIPAVIMEKRIMAMFNILDQINHDKKIEVAAAKDRIPLEILKDYPAYHREVPSFKQFLLSPEKSGIIAEHKRKSPSKGIINSKVILEEVITGYEKAGASAVSVLTDEKYFGGSMADLQKATEILNLPVLRKDFIVDEYQVHEAKAYGASVILLIAASLTREEVDRFARLAHQLGMEVLFEIHNKEELEKLSEHVDVVGVNNRNLKTFKVDIHLSEELASLIPNKYLKISESGISNPETVKNLKGYGYKGFLMGENFMKEENPGKACCDFINQLK